MTRKGMALVLALALLMGAAAVLTAPVLAQQQLGYWDRFKTLFVDWDDNAQPGSARTETVGVRGLEVEQELGDKDYDWDAVAYMEELKISVNDEMQFLQQGKLGPYQGQ